MVARLDDRAGRRIEGTHRLGRTAVVVLQPRRVALQDLRAEIELLRTHRVPQAQSWVDVFSFTNANARYRDQTFSHIKNAIQDNLEKYEERLKQFEAKEIGA